MFNAGALTFKEFAMQEALPLSVVQEAVLVIAPPDLIARKVISYAQRRGSPKAGIDWRDVAVLLLRFPDLKSNTGPAADRLLAMNADHKALDVWRELVAQEILPGEEDDEF